VILPGAYAPAGIAPPSLRFLEAGKPLKRICGVPLTENQIIFNKLKVYIKIHIEGKIRL
jgi:hypothetical protein